MTFLHNCMTIICMYIHIQVSFHYLKCCQILLSCLLANSKLLSLEDWPVQEWTYKESRTHEKIWDGTQTSAIFGYLHCCWDRKGETGMVDCVYYFMHFFMVPGKMVPQCRMDRHDQFIVSSNRASIT